MDEANSSVDPQVIADLWNEAAQVFADGAPVVPLFQQPQLVAWENGVTGPQLNATNATNLWNAGTWARTE